MDPYWTGADLNEAYETGNRHGRNYNKRLLEHAETVGRTLQTVLREQAIPTMKRQMDSDDATDAPYNEDMAQAIAACYRALGEQDEAAKWVRSVV
jgi:hypothetical protein